VNAFLAIAILATWTAAELPDKATPDGCPGGRDAAAEGALAATEHLVQRAFIAPKDSTRIYCRRAEEILLGAVGESPNDARLLARLALVNGQLVQFEDKDGKVARVRNMDRYCRSAILSDSTNAMAHLVYGILNYRLCRMSWIERLLAKAFVGDLPPASLEDAERYLKKAIALDGKSPCCYYALGRTLEAMDRDDEAVDSFRVALALVPVNQVDIRYQEKAADRLADLAEKLQDRRGCLDRETEDF
jgi:tetratricopeptide (TPR) repeat protein